MAITGWPLKVDTWDATLRQHFLAYLGRTQAASALPIYGGVD
jgi:hypothetical protein